MCSFDRGFFRLYSMPMPPPAKKGNFRQTPFALLLATLWREKACGSLSITKRATPQRLVFREGDIVITPASCEDFDFSGWLVQKKVLSNKEHTQTGHSQSQLLVLIEGKGFRADQAWDLLESCLLERLYAFFEWNEGTFAFCPGEGESSGILFRISTPTLVREGISRTACSERLLSYLPPENIEVCLGSPVLLDRLGLTAPERYLLNLVKKRVLLKDIYAESALGPKATQKMIAAFLLLDMIAPSGDRATETPSSRLSSLDLTKLLADFNERCSFIYKYMAKEIGPVASSVLEKCLEETKVHLPAVFAPVQLGRDGRLSTRPLIKNSLLRSTANSQQDLLRGLNEILVAEVLAVKKTLGDEHESQLIKSLRKFER